MNGRLCKTLRQHQWTQEREFCSEPDVDEGVFKERDEIQRWDRQTINNMRTYGQRLPKDE